MFWDQGLEVHRNEEAVCTFSRAEGTEKMEQAGHFRKQGIFDENKRQASNEDPVFQSKRRTAGQI